MRELLLRIENLSIASSTKVLVDCPSLEIARGDVVVLLGKSGSGKSLLCRAVTDTLRLTAPDLVTSGEMEWPNSSTSEGQRVGYVPQGTSSHLHPAYPVGEQVCQLIESSRCPTGAWKSRLRRILLRLNLRDADRVLASYPGELSGGMLQRVLLGLALTIEPKCIVLDEPVSALDGVSKSAAMSLIVEAAESESTGVLYATHDEAEAAVMATRVVSVSDGLARSRRNGPALENPPTVAYQDEVRVRRIEASRTANADTSAGERSARQPVLDASGVYVRGGDENQSILSNCTIRLHEGDRLGVLGESGSGKTTLIKILAALRDPSQGHVRVMGLDVSAASGRSIRSVRKYIQVVTQDPRECLNPLVRVRALFEEPARIHGYDRPCQVTMEAILKKLGLESEVLDSPAGRLSFGQQQRVAIARSIAGFPELRILLLDEPVSGLDEESRESVEQLITSMAPTVALVVASHDLKFLERVSVSLALLNDGVIAEQLPSQPWEFGSEYGRLYRRGSGVRSREDLRRIQRYIGAAREPRPQSAE